MIQSSLIYPTHTLFLDDEITKDFDQTPTRRDVSAKSTLHEVIVAERLDFEAKQERLAKRKLWLKAHQQLLRSLLSYRYVHNFQQPWKQKPIMCHVWI